MGRPHRSSTASRVTLALAGLLAVFDIAIWWSPDGAGPKAFGAILAVVVLLLVLAVVRDESWRLQEARSRRLRGDDGDDRLVG